MRGIFLFRIHKQQKKHTLKFVEVNYVSFSFKSPKFDPQNLGKTHHPIR